jgi:hypothetical protein
MYLYSKCLRQSRTQLNLKVICNEKEGGPGRLQTFAIGLGPWRSRFVCLLIWLSSLILIYFRFRQVKQNDKAMSSWLGNFDAPNHPALVGDAQRTEGKKSRNKISKLSPISLSLSITQKTKIIQKRCVQFAAFCPFMGTSPKNCALLGRTTGKRLNQRRQQI